MQQPESLKIVTEARRGKTLEEIYGDQRAKEIRIKMVSRKKGKSYEEIYGDRAAEMRHKSRAKNPIKGTYEERYGLERSIVIRGKLSTARKKQQFKKYGSLEEKFGFERAKVIKRKIAVSLQLKKRKAININDLDNREKLKIWRKAVFERDDYTCQECNNRGGVLHAHHKKPKSLYPDLTFDVNNGITLCETCHFSGDKHKEVPRLPNRPRKKRVKEFVPNKIRHVDDNQIEMLLTQNKSCFFDAADYSLLKDMHWFCQKHVSGFYYAQAKVGSKFYRMHRVILGCLSKTDIISHCNSNTLDNRRENLLPIKRSQLITERWNKYGKSKNNKGLETGLSGKDWVDSTDRLGCTPDTHPGIEHRSVAPVEGL
jgi:hypothetical protein